MRHHHYLVKYFLHDFAEALGLVLVVDQEEECQVSPLPPGALAEEGVVGLTHVGLPSQSGHGSIESQLFVSLPKKEDI